MEMYVGALVLGFASAFLVFKIVMLYPVYYSHSWIPNTDTAKTKIKLFSIYTVGYYLGMRVASILHSAMLPSDI